VVGVSYWMTTHRLGLRRFTAHDLDWLATMYNDGEVMRYLGGVKDRVKAQELLDSRILRYYDEHPGLSIWMTIERATEAPVGWHSLNHIRGESSSKLDSHCARRHGGRTTRRKWPPPYSAMASLT
jgi:RimJ/RimL family protein N-acetyltransferase